MDTSSPFFAPVSPVELEKSSNQVTFRQLIDHVRSLDQREVFLKNVIYNSPAPSVASSRTSSIASSHRPSTASSSRRPSPVDQSHKPSKDPAHRSMDPPRRPSADHFRRPSTDPSRRPSKDPSCSRSSSIASSRKASIAAASRRAKRSGLILITNHIKIWPDDDERDELASAITCSSIGSVRKRSTSGRALRNKLDRPTARKRSLQSGWWDEETDSEESDGDDPPVSIPELARRVALSPSRRSIENMKGPFDPGFSFSRRCLTSQVETVDPLHCPLSLDPLVDNWFENPSDPLSMSERFSN